MNPRFSQKGDTFCLAIHEARRETGFELIPFAELVGMSCWQLQAILAGKVKLSADVAQMIVQRLDGRINDDLLKKLSGAAIKRILSDVGLGGFCFVSPTHAMDFLLKEEAA